MTDSTSDLVHRLRDGDDTAFSELVAQWQSFVISHAYSVTGNTEDAKEVAQEVFINLYRKIGTLRDPAALKAFLRTAARNRALDHLRRRRGTTVPLDSIAEVEEPSDHRSPEGGMSQSEDSALVKRAILEALNELPPDQQEVIRLRYERNWSYSEIADYLGENLAVVRGRLYRAHKSLAGKLGHIIRSGYEL